MTIPTEILLWMLGGLCAAISFLIISAARAMQVRIEEVVVELKALNATLASIERDLRGELAGLDRRVGQLTTAMRSLHPEYRGLSEQ